MNDTADAPRGGNGTDTGGPAPAPQLVVGAQYIRDLSFENPLGLDTAARLQKRPEVSIDVNTSASAVADDAYEVVLAIRVDARIDGEPAFIVELSYGGAFQLAGVPRERAREVILVEGPRHLFPFARAVISDVVRDGGFPALMINPIDFAALHASQRRGGGGGGGDGGSGGNGGGGDG